MTRLYRRWCLWWARHEAAAELRWERHYTDQAIAAADRRREWERVIRSQTAPSLRAVPRG